jgi:hypothetical protein
MYLFPLPDDSEHIFVPNREFGPMFQRKSLLQGSLQNRGGSRKRSPVQLPKYPAGDPSNVKDRVKQKEASAGAECPFHFAEHLAEELVVQMVRDEHTDRSIHATTGNRQTSCITQNPRFLGKLGPKALQFGPFDIETDVPLGRRAVNLE